MLVNEPGASLMPTAWLVIWLLAAGWILFICWRNARMGAGLVLAYVAQFWLIHWIAAALYALPWHPFFDTVDTIEGFLLSCYGLIAFAVGSTAFVMTHQTEHQEMTLAHIVLGGKLAWFYFLSGAVFYLLSYTPIASLPTLNAVLHTAKQMTLVGICLHCWLAWRTGDRLKFQRWLMVAAVFPVITVLTQGFMGYGMMAMMLVCAFVAVIYRPRWHVILFGAAGIYLGLSVYVAYVSHRNEIRAAVWGGAPYAERVQVIQDALANLEPFAPTDERHLIHVDNRLNQNRLVGMAAAYTSHSDDYAHGDTLWQAAIALVPRALWPDKPVVAGSMGLVGLYTGLEFAPGTSVGMGQVFEFYINFGVWGVVLGFALLGYVLAWLDWRASRSLSAADWHGFALWFLVGIAALQVGGSLVEITAGMAASALAAYLVRKFWSPTRRAAVVRTST